MRVQKIILLYAIIQMYTVACFAQASHADIVNKNVPVTWLGLDFTDAKLIGDRERLGSLSDIKYLIKSWNDLIESEYERKYNIAAALHKTKADVKIDITRTHNDGLDVSEMISNNESDHLRLNEDNIAAIIKQYDFDGLTGLGLMFNVESFDKLKNEAIVWVTFIDLVSKEMILTARLQTHPGGTNLRNYWGNAIAEDIELVRGREFDGWKKKYGR
jgi:hypothetical protein